MPRKDPHLTTLEARKQLLLVESEVNRVELLKDVEHLKNEISRVKKEVYTVGSIASSAALITTAVSVFRRRFMKREAANGRSTMFWIASALDGARLGASLFRRIKSLLRERE